jgi:protein-export membrane protein SecD
MLRFPPWKIAIVVLTLIVGVTMCIPNFFQDAEGKSTLKWLPTQPLTLGLDLKGGASILLEVDPEELRTNELRNNVGRNIREDLRGARIASTRREVVGDHLEVHIANAADVPAAEQRIRRLGDPPLGTIGQQNSYVVTSRGNVIEVRFTEQAFQKLQADALTSSIEAVRRRADNSGLVEPNIQKQGDSRIIVEVPGLDPAELDNLIETLTTAGVLTFNMVDVEASNQVRLDPSSWTAGQESGGRTALPNDGDFNGGLQVIETDAIITGADLSGATQDFDQRNRPSISFQLHPAGAQRFGRATAANVGRPFAIVLDDRIVSAPTIQSPIMTGNGQITGSFTIESAEQLAIVLRSGALPAKLRVADRRVVDASLGADSIRAGVMATIVGLILITIFMLTAYGLLGLFALIAVYFNLILLIGILSGFGATLTLPGIAGILLTMGMSVDANVLQFERIREEKRAGRSPITSVEAGFDHSFSTIIDANMTHFIAGVVMFMLGAGPIRGFAITLAIGIATSLFTSVMLARLLLTLWLKWTRPKYIPI